MVEVDVKITADDLYDYMLMHTYNSAAGLIGSGFGAVLIIYGFGKQEWLFLILGIVMLVRLLQLEKAYLLMVVTLSGISTLVRPVQSPNA